VDPAGSGIRCEYGDGHMGSGARELVIILRNDAQFTKVQGKILAREFSIRVYQVQR
jgi:hypothetical protein